MGMDNRVGIDLAKGAWWGRESNGGEIGTTVIEQ